MEMPMTGDASKQMMTEEVGCLAHVFNERYLHWSQVRMRDTGSFHPDLVWARMRSERSEREIVLTFGNVDYRFSITDAMTRMMEDAEFLQETCDLDEMLVRESLASALMEGASTTLRKVRCMLSEGVPPENVSDRMVLNIHRAMTFVSGNGHPSMTPESILHIHGIVMDGVLDEGCAGRFRDNDDVVVQDVMSGEVFHRPVPKGDILPGIEGLCDFINRGGDSIPPLIKGIIIHYVIAHIHPFEDGNGRVARVMFYWYVLACGCRFMEHLPLSEYIREHKGRYEESFVFAETDGNDMGYFIMYNLQTLGHDVGTRRIDSGRS